MTASLGADEFVEAFTQHGRTLWVLAAAWVGRNDAQDLVQEVARVAWQRRDQFAVGSDLRAWLSQIARHIGANWRRRLRPELRAPADLPDAAAPAPAPAPAIVPWPFDVDRHGLSDELVRALGTLPEPARASLLLHVVADHSFAEIGKLLELPENTVSSHARRARLALRAALAATSLHPSSVPESS
ncbi:MAG: sigma-70 family RNA polymerase sigma factor [Planctomycetota bacterium]